MKKTFLVLAFLAALTVSAQAQFVDRIVRPCAAGATTLASVVVNPSNSGNIVVTSCVGGQLIVNGVPVITNGLADPGSNGIVVRTAVNTTVARTMTGSGGITVANGSGVAAAPDVSITDVLVAGSCTSCNLTYNGKGQVTVAGNSSSGANTALSNLASVAINTNLLPGSDFSLFLGSSTRRWAGVRLGPTSTVEFTDPSGTDNRIAYTDAVGPRFYDDTAGFGLTFNLQLLTSNRTVIWPNQAGTVCTTGSVCAGYAAAGSGVTCAGCASNALPKTTGAGALGDSRITDNATDINIDSGAGTTTIGDVNAAGNGTKITVNDMAGLVTIASQTDIVGSVTLEDTISPLVAGGSQLGNSGAPFSSLYLGSAANATARISCAACSANRAVILPDKDGTISFVIPATSGSIGGGLLTAGSCASGTTAVTGSTTSMTVSVSPNTYPGDGSTWFGYVSVNGTVTVKVCAIVALTPGASTYNIRVIQ